MRRSPLVAATLLSGLLAGAAAASSPSYVTAPAPVSAVAFDGARVAYAVGASAGDCNRVRLWNVSTGGVTRLGRGVPCAQTSTGTGVASVALAGNRALWLNYIGGNIREWTLWTASGTSPKPRRLAFAAKDVDAPSPIVVGDGNTSRKGDLLPYAVDRAVIVLRTSGARRFTWRAPAQVVALDARDGQVAVATADGTVTVLDAAGHVVTQEQLGPGISAVQLSGNALVAQIGRTLDVVGPGPIRQYSLPAGARLQDALESTALYAVGGSVISLSTSTGDRLVVARGTAGALESSLAAVASGRRVLLRPA
jgi:hypothetical protein